MEFCGTHSTTILNGDYGYQIINNLENNISKIATIYRRINWVNQDVQNTQILQFRTLQTMNNDSLFCLI